MRNSMLPREKLERMGPAGLKEEELLSILFGTGTRGKDVLTLSRELIRTFDNCKLLKASLADLTKVKGIGSAKASVLIAAFELSQRLMDRDNGSVPRVEKPQDALVHVQEIRGRKKEHFVALYLDARNRIVHREFVSIGSLNTTVVHPREVFVPAIQHTCASVILCHNHPSGDCEPSPEDVELTRRLISAGELLGIEVLDHLVVSDKNYLSMKESGWI